ncbi:ESX secretion-associated protein EspG [Nocardia sp. CDC160]|uniref:ESX secretion-associated protein EspG n=1 Tax=Nocardia sp. CDC160 TaxID=3112166 RepID=UPI002DBD3253|nr:ESX secretion-associated protein EspG [Nocardia sp. CDC160]MEC3919245.1 ESX secretion-associated protein EspG [Nocardia sp. CDC160]
MENVWRFSDVEFVAFVESAGLPCLPRPLVFTSRTLLWDDYLVEKSTAAVRAREILGPSTAPVSQALVQPDVRVVMQSWDARNPANPQRSTRLYGVRCGDYGYVVEQLPGETHYHSGGFVVTECPAVALSNTLVSLMPEAKAGGLGEMILRHESDGYDYSYGRSVALRPVNDTEEDRMQSFLDADVVAVGVVETEQGWSRFGPRAVVKHSFVWRDLANDGRYVLRFDNPPTVTAADESYLISSINSDIARVVSAIKDERR